MGRNRVLTSAGSVLAAAAAVLCSASVLPSSPAWASAATAFDSAAPPSVNLASYVVVDIGTGKILAAQAPHEKYAPASTIKVLTADTLIPRLSASMTVTPAAADFAAEPDGSVVGMSAGVTYSVADLWRAAFLVSGNDAIAELAHLSGGESETVALMRSKARALGANDTVIGDADGYDYPGQVTSAYDLALFARAGLNLSDFRRYCGLRSGTFPEPNGRTTTLESHDPMLLHYPGMIGIKGGITTAAGHTYIGAAVRNGHTLVVTAMHGGTDIWDQVTKLMDWGFAADGTVAGVGTLGPAVVSPTPVATTTATRVRTSSAAPTTTSTPVPTSSTTPVTTAVSTPSPTASATSDVTTPSPSAPLPAPLPMTVVAAAGDRGGSGPGVRWGLAGGVVVAAGVVLAVGRRRLRARG
jgi:D-alanyl-D-alanine carboxypeptidase (penicillin-binding protein 5/6)